MFTPVEARADVMVKRDDLYEVAGVSGGKARTCWALAQGATGLVTAGSRSSPQANIVAHVAAELGIPCAIVTPTGTPGPEVEEAVSLGAERIAVTPGYNTVICRRAADLAYDRGWKLIPFGMEHPEAVVQTAGQVANVPASARRIVIPVGSGMSLAGVLTGLQHHQRTLPVVGVQVGADPHKRLDTYAPPFWRTMARIVPSGVPYDRKVEAVLDGLRLDPVYEAKCLPFLEPGDLLWVVGVREEARCR